MANNIPNQRKQLFSPADDISVLDIWKSKFRQYTEIEGMRKYAAMERIAKESGGKSPTNVNRWLFQDVREKENEYQKIIHKNRDRKIDQSASTMYVHRNISKLLEKTFENTECPLTISEITYRIQDELRNKGRYPVLIKNGTLLDKVDKFYSNHNIKLLELVKSNGDDYYNFAPKK